MPEEIGADVAVVLDRIDDARREVEEAAKRLRKCVGYHREAARLGVLAEELSEMGSQIERDEVESNREANP